MKIFYNQYITIYFEQEDERFLGSFETFARNMENNTKKYQEIDKVWIKCCSIDTAQKVIMIYSGREDIVKMLKSIQGLKIEEIDKRIKKEMKIPFKHVWGFRDHIQKGFVEEFMESETKNHYGVLPCGAGKTYGALKIAELL